LGNGPTGGSIWIDIASNFLEGRFNDGRKGARVDIDIACIVEHLEARFRTVRIARFKEVLFIPTWRGW
jgi:hypothetical protein